MYVDNAAMQIIKNPLEFHELQLSSRQEKNVSSINLSESKKQHAKRFKRGYQCLRENGFRYTLGKIFEKLAWRLKK